MLRRPTRQTEKESESAQTDSTSKALRRAERLIEKAHREKAITLKLARLGLTELPEALGALTQLQRLVLDENNLVTLPEFLGHLNGLRELELHANKLTTLPETLGRLTKLERLHLGDNRLAALPSVLGKMPQLRELFIWENGITELPEFLGRLTSLKALYAGRNSIAQLPKWLGNLANLRVLQVWRNRLRSVPESIGQLTQLRALDIFENELTLLPDSMGCLSRLSHLDVSDNQLITLPESLRGLKKLESLYLHGNAALGLPSEVLGPKARELQGRGSHPVSPAAILDYFFRTRQGRRPLNEAKLILVGRGGVGKTCLIKRLIHDTFDEHEPETPGIEIQPWQVELPAGETVRLHVWDFGGQEILHATHQFFLTERTIYLLVLSGREGNPTQDAEYWLQLIRSFGSDSRVVIALNKSLRHPFDVNRGLLVEKYPFIADFVKTDCEGPTLGLLELRRLIVQQTEALDHRRVDFPSDWFAIKERLADMTKHDENFVTWDQYQEICRGLGEPNIEAQRQLARYLHTLGIALNYRDDPRLRDHHVLNPNWVTEGIYTLLRATKNRGREGILAKEDLAMALDTKRYPPSCHAFLLHLMEKFQVCFRLPGKEERYLVPELLGDNQPDEIKVLLAAPGLGFRYQYEVLPEGLLPRFIVQTHLYSKANPHWRWRTGVVLDRDGCRAVVRADARERRVDIYITGLETRRRELLAIARAAFEEQHRDLKGLTVEERVPIPGKPSVTVSYRKLLNLEERAVADYEPENLDVPVPVKSLLNGIESPKTRARKQHDTTGLRSKPLHVSEIKGKVHVAIITVRHDEYDAVEARLEDSIPVEGGNNSYEYAAVQCDNKHPVSVVLTRCVAQGNTSAQAVANNIIQDIDPGWLLLVGIAGGVPDNEFSLGDVIVASALHDFSFGAALGGGKRTYETTGGQMHPDVARFLQTKIVGRNRARLLDLAGFATEKEFLAHPTVFGLDQDRSTALYGDPDFRAKVVKSIDRRFPGGARKGPPLVWSGPCANGNVLVKDPQLLKEWQTSGRQIVDMETELSGVYEAARSAGRQNYPLLAIRGLSDIVGLKRDADWTEYACQVAAAFAWAVLRSGFIDFSKNLPAGRKVRAFKAPRRSKQRT